MPPFRHSKGFSPDRGREFILPPNFIPNWIKVYKPCRATPLPWSLVQAMAGLALSSGQRRLAVALRIVLQFLVFLSRTAEIYGLRPRDVSCLNSGHVVVALSPKVSHSWTPFSAGYSFRSWHLGLPLPLSSTRLCKLFGQDCRNLLSSKASKKREHFCPMGLREEGPQFTGRSDLLKL